MSSFNALTQNTLTVLRDLGGFAWNYNFKVTSIVNADTKVQLVTGDSLPLASAKLPGVKLNTAKVPYGAFEINVPMNITFPENMQWTVSLFSDNKGVLRNIFQTWQTDLYDFKTQKGKSNFKYDISLELGTNELTNAVTTNIKTGLEALANAVGNKTDDISVQIQNAIIGWKQSSNHPAIITRLNNVKDKGVYSTQVATISQYTNTSNSKWNPTQTYTLYSCFPVMLDGIQYTAENPDVIKFSAVIAYQYFEKTANKNTP